MKFIVSISPTVTLKSESGERINLVLKGDDFKIDNFFEDLVRLYCSDFDEISSLSYCFSEGELFLIFQSSDKENAEDFIDRLHSFTCTKSILGTNYSIEISFPS